MCGIVGAVAERPITGILIEGLKRLEYRGYDSAGVAVLDSNGDKLTDRIYATDTGANVWRFDLPSAKTSEWSAFKFASLGGNSKATDRRFFAEAAVAQTVFTNISEVQVTDGSGTKTIKTYQNVPYDAVVIGTGNRPHPSDKNRSDMFFTLQDRNVASKSFASSTNNGTNESNTLS